jgi:hypothetical protein
MTLGELLVLSFLAFQPRPVCTVEYPHGVVTGGMSCPAGALGNDSGIFDGVPCIRRFRA